MRGGGDTRKTGAEYVLYVTASSALVGGIYGTIIEGWRPPSLELRKQKIVPPLVKAAKTIGANAALLGFAGFGYATTREMLQTARGKDDAWNTVASGIVGGSIAASRGGPKYAVGIGLCFGLAIGFYQMFTQKIDPILRDG